MKYVAYILLSPKIRCYEVISEINLYTRFCTRNECEYNQNVPYRRAKHHGLRLRGVHVADETSFDNIHTLYIKLNQLGQRELITLPEQMI